MVEKKQWLSCPPECYQIYIDYLNRRDIPFDDIIEDGQRWLIFDKKYRPHAWKLDFETSCSDD